VRLSFFADEGAIDTIHRAVTKERKQRDKTSIGRRKTSWSYIHNEISQIDRCCLIVKEAGRYDAVHIQRGRFM
jgi:hypothetical protein